MRNDNQLIWEAFQSKITEARRTPEETERLVRNLERYQYLMSAQEQGEGDYFDWDEFEDYSDYEDEIEALEKEAEANGYLKQLKGYADFDARDERRSRQSDEDPLENKPESAELTKAGKLSKRQIAAMKKDLNPKSSYQKRYSSSVRGMKKPNLP